MAFSGDPALWYNYPIGGVWGRLGFAVPNWGKRLVSRNLVLVEMAEIIGRNLQAIMVGDDACSRTPPHVDVIREIHKLVLRARGLLATEALASNQDPMRGTHGINNKQSFLLFPTPLFKVRNRWMKTYCFYAMAALAECLQHTQNTTMSFEIDAITARTIGQYFVRIYKRVAVELLNIDPKDASVPKDANTGLPVWEAFTLSDAQINAYDPEKWFSSTELIDVAPPSGDMPSSYDLEFLTNGIPIIDMPALTPFPATIPDSEADNATADAQLVQNQAVNPANSGVAQATIGTNQTFALPPGTVLNTPLNQPNTPVTLPTQPGASQAAAAPATTNVLAKPVTQ